MSTQKPDGAGSVDDTLVRAAVPDDPRSKKKGRGGKIAGVLFGVLVILALGLYGVGYLIAGDKLPRNAQIGGVAVGGLDRDEAITKLETELKDKAEKPIPVTVNGAEDQVAPAEAGMSIDYGRSVDQSGVGKSLDPRHIWRVITGGTAMDPITAVDDGQLKTAVAALAKKHDAEPKDATVKMDGAKIKQSKSVSKVVVDQSAAAEALEEAYLQPVPVVDLAAEVTDPDVTTAEVEKVVEEFAEPAVSGPVTVSVASHGKFDVTPEMIGSAITFVKKDGTLVPNLASKKLHKQAEPALSKVELKKPKDATVKLKDGKPTVVPAVNGTGVSEANLYKAVQPALAKSGSERTATVELTGQKAKFTTEDAKKLGVKEVIGEFTTKYPHADYRNTNIGRAADLMNNSLLKPGEEFSMNNTVGERTADNGFVDGYVISGGVLKKETGGGVSQTATTVYNAMFLAGLKDIEHQPHTLYFPRYPAGREATVYWGAIDLRFQNDTDHGVLVQAFTKESSPGKEGSITVRMWSTQEWDEIKAPPAKKSDFYSGTTRTSDSPSCEYQAAIEGFRADYYRAFIKDGKEAKREKFTWKYAAGDEIKCD